MNIYTAIKKEEKKRKIWPIVMFVIVLVVAPVAFYYIKSTFFTYTKNPNSYYAFFLSNGQVYFGKLERQDSQEIDINNVYYLESVANAATPAQTLQSSNFSLVKMGSELHGPTDELFINRSQLLFYEELRPDSKVVQSIATLQVK